MNDKVTQKAKNPGWVQAGLAAFISGDMRSAVLAWRSVARDDADFSHAQKYLEYCRAMLPELTPHLESIADSESVSTYPSTADFESFSPVDGWRAQTEGAIFVEATNKNFQPVICDVEANLRGPHWLEQQKGTPAVLSQLQRASQQASGLDENDSWKKYFLSDPEQCVAKLREYSALDDADDGYRLASQAIDRYPDDGRITDLLKTFEAQLQRQYLAMLGELQTIPKVVASANEIIWLNLDQWQGFVLSQVDGVASYEDILSVLNMKRFVGLRHLAQLKKMGVITDHADDDHAQ